MKVRSSKSHVEPDQHGGARRKSVKLKKDTYVLRENVLKNNAIFKVFLLCLEKG